MLKLLRVIHGSIEGQHKDMNKKSETEEEKQKKIFEIFTKQYPHQNIKSNITQEI